MAAALSEEDWEQVARPEETISDKGFCKSRSSTEAQQPTAEQQQQQQQQHAACTSFSPAPPSSAGAPATPASSAGPPPTPASSAPPLPTPASSAPPPPTPDAAKSQPAEHRAAPRLNHGPVTPPAVTCVKQHDEKFSPLTPLEAILFISVIGLLLLITVIILTVCLPKPMTVEQLAKRFDEAQASQQQQMQELTLQLAAMQQRVAAVMQQLQQHAPGLLEHMPTTAKFMGPNALIAECVWVWANRVLAAWPSAPTLAMVWGPFLLAHLWSTYFKKRA